MEQRRQKLDFSRPVLPLRCSGQTCSESEKYSLYDRNSGAIFNDWEKTSGSCKQGKNFANLNSESHFINGEKISDSASHITFQQVFDGSEGFSCDDEVGDQIDEWDTHSKSVSSLSDNFRVSGFSAMDESYADSLATDFMMRRFLSAAKTISSNSSKKWTNHTRVNEARPNRATEYRTRFDEDVDYNDDENQSHISGRRLYLKCLSQTKSKSFNEAPTECARNHRTIFQNSKNLTENLDRFHDKASTFSSVNSLFKEMEYFSIAKEKKCLTTESMQMPHPPMPPSNSWLRQALPSISSKNRLMQPSHDSNMDKHFKKTAPEQKTAAPKSETMVKTNYLRRGDLLYTKEILTPIRELEVLPKKSNDSLFVRKNMVCFHGNRYRHFS